jgi:hypothetical protein
MPACALSDLHDVQYVDNSDLNKLAANDDMTLQVNVGCVNASLLGNICALRVGKR